MFLSTSYSDLSSETQGRSVGPGEKAQQKFSSTGGKAPGYRLSPDHFQTVKRMLVPDWAQKMLCIIVPDGYFLATVARFVQQEEQFNLHWENSVSNGSQCIVNNRKFKK